MKTATDVKQLLDELDSWFEEKGFGKSIEYSEPVSKEEIKKAEKELGVKFPPSYVEFVLKYGTFNIDGGLTGRGSGNDTNLFSPSEMVGKTNEYRDEFKDTNSEEIKGVANENSELHEDLYKWIELFRQNKESEK